MITKTVKCGKLNISNTNAFTLIAGPCQLENEKHALEVAMQFKKTTDKLGIGLIYKTSFDKANRTASDSFRGPDIDEGLSIFSDVKNEIGVPVITDVHLPDQCNTVAEVVDILQIPAFLCRQTDLVLAAGETGKTINIKKGQFLAPGKMTFAAEKVSSTGNNNILLTERGTSFGYDLVSDMTAIPIMKSSGYPVVFDATHSCQSPGANSTTGGHREMIPVLAKSAIAAGADGLFMEVHDNPSSAKSEASTQWPLDKLEELLIVVKKIFELVNA